MNPQNARRLLSLFSIVALATFTLVACDNDAGADRTGEAAAGDQLEGTVSIDGSSTVFPITEAVAEEFRNVEPRVRVTVGVSGTGGGFKKFAAGETDINDASRAIKESERSAAAEGAIEYIELPIAYDGISLVIHPENDWVDHLTVDEVHRIWMPDSEVTTWADVRAGWPAEPITLFGPGPDSGTFDYFTDAINGDEGAIRPDFTASEDDNVIVAGVSGDPHALGFFGFAYYAENKDKLRVVPVDNGAGAVEPSNETINNGSYAPLSRPIFIYVSPAAAERPEVDAFVDFYLDNVAALAPEVGYVALPDALMAAAKARYEGRVAGSVFPNAPEDATLLELFQ